MQDFNFLQNPISKKWVVQAPRRAKRPDVAKGTEPVCPFCPGREGEEEVYRLHETTQNGTQNNTESDWLVRVLKNKFPFAPIHEVIIHSPDHSKNFDKLPLSHIELIIQTYRQRYNEHKEKGQVYIFHNRGEAGGESLPHPHTQLAVVPFEVKIDTPRLDPTANDNVGPNGVAIDTIQTTHFYLFCPLTSQWPDEIWIAPKNRGRAFGEINDGEIKDLSFILSRLIQIFDLRHNRELPFNFYIYPGGDWYLRITPRLKTLGGFEIGTGIFINTQDPKETLEFIKTHFEEPDEERIQTEHQADYKLRV